jgi:polyisoprenoid-binding protein YceI
MTTRSLAAFHPSAANPKRRTFLAALLLWACCRAVAAENSAAHAGAVQAELNPSKCAVHFTLGAFLHTVHGTFKVNAGTIRFDPSSDHLTGQISVDVKSGQTGNSARDRQMHENVLESDRYPEAVFTLSSVQGRLALDGESHVDVRGMLRIHGTEHELTVPAIIKVRHDIVTATADFTLPYVAWGMKDPSNLLLRVDKTVSVHVELNGAVASPSISTYQPPVHITGLVPRHFNIRQNAGNVSLQLKAVDLFH